MSVGRVEESYSEQRRRGGSTRFLVVPESADQVVVRNFVFFRFSFNELYSFDERPERVGRVKLDTKK